MKYVMGDLYAGFVSMEIPHLFAKQFITGTICQNC